ncbi:MAG: nitrilase family protein [Bacteroidales bacterium]|nr:nitrilase family protein [Bacteroidales bacterium]
MKVALIQQNIAWADPETNRDRLSQVISRIPEKIDLIVLPEMFSTGFTTEPAGIAEKGSESLRWMQETAARYDCAVAGSIALERDGKFYNHFAFVTAEGELASYDKKHLFTFGGEHKRFTPGHGRTVVSWRGVRFLLSVCYDLRFPVFLRNREDYDALLCVASWPAVRRYPWDTLLRARAIENQCFVCGVNRVGDDPSLHYSGGTVLLDYLGQPLAQVPDETEGFAVGEIDPEALRQAAEKFPVLRDADAFALQ